MKTNTYTKLIIGAVLSIFVVPCNATIVFNNGAPDQSGFGDEMTQSLVGENFSVGSSTTLTDIRFWAIADNLASEYAGQIYYALYTSSTSCGSGTIVTNCPGTLLTNGLAAAAVFTSTGNSVLATNDEYQVDFSLNSVFALTGSTTYYLVLHNGATSNTANSNFLWETTATGNAPTGDFLYLSGGAAWQDTGFEHAFLLQSNPASVPEPGSIIMLGSGIAGLALFRKKRVSRN